MSSNLNFDCPYCNHKYTDELEVLDEDVSHNFKCENCAKPFVMLTKECETCRKDMTYVWRKAPDSETLSALQCRHCGKPVHFIEEPEQED